MGRGSHGTQERALSATDFSRGIQLPLLLYTHQQHCLKVPATSSILAPVGRSECKVEGAMWAQAWQMKIRHLASARSEGFYLGFTRARPAALQTGIAGGSPECAAGLTCAHLTWRLCPLTLWLLGGASFYTLSSLCSHHLACCAEGLAYRYFLSVHI